MIVNCFESSEKNVWKYVFRFGNAIAEAVLYRYPDFETRTVLCVSVQSGCPVGCRMCATGKRFIRNLTQKEIVYQVVSVLQDKNIAAANCEKLQIMFMSMGEPFLNYGEVRAAIIELNSLYPNADLLVSTICPDKKDELLDFIELSKKINKIGLQFSIHRSFDSARNNLIPFNKKLCLRELRDYGIQWWKETGRTQELNKGSTKSCGCYHKQICGRFDGYEDISKKYWSNVIYHSSHKRNLAFDITIEYAWDIFERQNRLCVYSGIPLIFVRNYGKNSDIQTASLDRIDSSKGYVEGNVQWVHKTINQMKSDMTEDYFLYIVDSIYNYRLKQNVIL